MAAAGEDASAIAGFALQAEASVCRLFHRTLGCGTVRDGGGISHFVVLEPIQVSERVVPFFRRFPLVSAEQREAFEAMARLVATVD